MFTRGRSQGRDNPIPGEGAGSIPAPRIPNNHTKNFPKNPQRVMALFVLLVAAIIMMMRLVQGW